ncbi:SAM-dependent methyltransferase [Blastopirellula marina]|uniref:SAM-dependent methyltransferase n=1 Tax=Blastopirellula marina TaxID=124 RepID=A0A2S8FEP6_9BACT|nr:MULTISPECIES: cyclopropane-fatty-acyl-phospholipid synthase family protein [Pirellulaceae]PQO30617.1 SAM-dependent methyltransferase [Blastopirellula marina]RCS50754.1 class I SAM-dependent methyltransferase [Bremerella cremea]
MSHISSSAESAYSPRACSSDRTGLAELAIDHPSLRLRKALPQISSGLHCYVARQCRKILHRTLSQIEAGHILIIDPLGQVQFGPTHDVELRAVVRIDDLRVYRHMMLGGTLAAAEAYLQGKWVCNDLTALLRIMARNLDSLKGIERKTSFWLAPWRNLQQWRTRNSKVGSRKNIAAHYDLSNEFFQLMLDPTMMYSSGIYEREDATLQQASIAKLDRICQKLDLQPGSRVLEIGTGWGGFAEYAARNYGCHVTTTTISQQQFNYACRRIEEAGLQDQVTLLKRDYRDLTGTYDHVVSIEMIEAVGRDYLDTYFEKCGSLLKPHGTMALQVITIPDERVESYSRGIDFIQRYIFPGGFLPSYQLMARSIARKTDLRIVHAEDFGSHYARTLAAWRENFMEHLPRIRALGMDDYFLRMWEYYLAYCEAGFHERQIGVSQLVMAKPKFRGDAILGKI